jgi:hypothetical protein
MQRKQIINLRIIKQKKPSCQVFNKKKLFSLFHNKTKTAKQQFFYQINSRIQQNGQL